MPSAAPPGAVVLHVPSERYVATPFWELVEHARGERRGRGNGCVGRPHVGRFQADRGGGAPDASRGRVAASASHHV